MKLCCGLMDGQLWDATLQTSSEGDSEGGLVVVLSNDEILPPQDADFGEFSIADATEDERRSLKQAGYNMPDWDPMQWLGCGSCQADHRGHQVPRQFDRTLRDRRTARRRRPHRMQDIVDTYGGMARHGGGAFSGKDPSKVDSSAAYFARYIAKHVVAAKLARRCEVQFAYASGVAQPVSMLVHTFGTGVVSDDKLSAAVAKVFDASPGLLTQELDLRRPIFRKTAAYGHFGREEAEFTWEKTPKLEALKDVAHVGNGVSAKAKPATKAAAAARA